MTSQRPALLHLQARLRMELRPMGEGPLPMAALPTVGRALRRMPEPVNFLCAAAGDDSGDAGAAASIFSLPTRTVTTMTESCPGVAGKDAVASGVVVGGGVRDSALNPRTTTAVDATAATAADHGELSHRVGLTLETRAAVGEEDQCEAGTSTKGATGIVFDHPPVTGKAGHGGPGAISLLTTPTRLTRN